MKGLRKPSEVTLKNGKTLEKVLELHKKWLNGEDEGERANLSGEDLSYSDLSGVNLSWANLEGTDLEGTNLEGTDLKGADLSHANLSGAILIGANLSYADLSEASLIGAKFYLTNLYKSKGDFVSVGNIGSRNDTTHYFYKDNRIICGCFSGTMKDFEEKVKESYGEYEVEYKEYIIAIDTLKRLAELHMNN